MDSNPKAMTSGKKTMLSEIMGNYSTKVDLNKLRDLRTKKSSRIATKIAKLRMVKMKENKILEMFAQVLRGLAEIKQDMREFKQDIQGLKQDFQELKDFQLNMEAELTEKIDSIYNFMAEQRDFNEEVIRRLHRIEAKIDVLLGYQNT